MSWNRYELACIMAAPATGSAPPARTSKARTSTPRPGFQELSYTVERDALPPSTIVMRLRVKEP